MPRMIGDKQKKKDERARNWNFILYDESAPSDWSNYLDDLHIQWIESPWHDKDLKDDGSGEYKKKHKHITLVFEGKKSFEQIKAITDSLNCPRPEKCNCLKSYIRYMAHLDHPDKAQYNFYDIVPHGGLDLDSCLAPTRKEELYIIRDMQKYIMENNIISYSKFMDFCAREHFDDWFYLLCKSCSYVIRGIIESNRNDFLYGDGSKKNKIVNNVDDIPYIVDHETGELIENVTSNSNDNDVS